MIRILFIPLIFTLSLSQVAFSADLEDDTGLKKTEQKEPSANKRNPKAEADAALKRVEAMTRKARDRESNKDKKDKKPKK